MSDLSGGDILGGALNMKCTREGCNHYLMQHKREHNAKRPPYKCQVEGCDCKDLIL